MLSTVSEIWGPGNATVEKMSRPYIFSIRQVSPHAVLDQPNYGLSRLVTCRYLTLFYSWLNAPIYFSYIDRYTFRVKPMHASLSGDSVRLSFARVLDHNAG